MTAERHGIHYYPTILVLREDGTEIDRVVGYYPATEFMTLVEDYLAGRNTLASLLAEETNRSLDAEFVFRLGERLTLSGRTADARQRLVRVVALDPQNATGKVDDALYTLSRMCRKEKNYEAARAYAQEVVDRYPDSDMMKPAFLQVGINWRRAGKLDQARDVFLDYAKRFPEDEDASWAREQADSLAFRIGRGGA